MACDCDGNSAGFRADLPATRILPRPFLAPLALSGVKLVRTVAARVDVDRQTVRTAYVVGIVVSALIYGLVVEAAVLSGTGIPGARALSDATAAEIDGVESDEAVAAGHEIRRMGIENASQIGFVGQ